MQKSTRRHLTILSFCAAGILFLLITPYIGVAGIFTGIMGLILLVAYCILAIVDVRLTEKAASKNIPANILNEYDDARKKQAKELHKDINGLAWVWIAGFVLTLPFCALIYFALGYPFSLIAGTVTASYTLTGAMASAWTLTQLLLSYLMAFVIIFVVIYVLMNSKPNPGEY